MKKKKRKKIHAMERAVEVMGLPIETESSILKVTLLGHRRTLIENHKGVYAYTEKGITLTGPEGLVSVYGSDLEIRELDNERMLVDGYITGVTYE
ncbi:MAG: YabP/YqfC family sporulation protein [Clostridia bacterium]|nr:YabP/YqfC family sporulation protein [Clostridia bacterium]